MAQLRTKTQQSTVEGGDSLEAESLRAQLKAAQESMKSQQKEIAKWRNKCIELESQMQDLNQKVREKDNRVNTLVAELERVNQLVTEKNAAIGQLNIELGKLEEKEREIEELQAEGQQLKEQLLGKNKENERLKKLNFEQKAKIDE